MRYDPVGVSFYSGYAHSFHASIICIDRNRSSGDIPFLVNISFEGDFDKTEFFNLFKRFNVIVTFKIPGYNQFEIEEEIMFDDRSSSEGKE